MLRPEVQSRSANKLSQQTHSYQRDQAWKVNEGETKRQDGRSCPKSCCPARGWRNHDDDLSAPDHDWSEGFTTSTTSSRKGNNSFVFVQTMKPSSQINIRSWRYVGTTALEDMILGMGKCAVRDTHNVVSSDDFLRMHRDYCLPDGRQHLCPCSPNFRTLQRWG